MKRLCDGDVKIVRETLISFPDLCWVSERSPGHTPYVEAILFDYL